MRRGIPIENPRDRGAEILADPDGYYRRAREEARRIVERDAARPKPHRTLYQPPPKPDWHLLAAGLSLLAVLALACLGLLYAAAR